MAVGSAAWAEIPADGGSAPIQPPAVAAGGKPGWQITLIALGVALVAAAAAVILDRPINPVTASGRISAGRQNPNHHSCLAARICVHEPPGDQAGLSQCSYPRGRRFKS